MAGVGVAGILSVGLTGIAYADPAACQVISSSGRCLVAAIDPGRPGGPRPAPPADQPVGPSSRRPPALPRGPSRAEVEAAAAQLVDAVRARALGPPPAQSDLTPAGRAPAARSGAAAQAASAESVQRAVNELDLPAVRIRLSAAGKGFVGTPVWLWLDGGQALTGPRSATAAVGGAAVTATARLVSVDWTLGPPGGQVTCTGPGTPWIGQPGPSPDCGYVYDQRSLPERTGGTGRWPIVATAHWEVDWRGVSNGFPVNGAQALQLSNTTTLAVGELQALVIGDGR